MKIITHDANGEENGWVLPVWNCRESDYRPDQVYVTAVYPNTVKGPHLHKIRNGYFSCISGNAIITMRQDGVYKSHRLGIYNADDPLWVPPGVPMQIRNVTNVTAIILNMPSPSWSADEPDEWPVEGWDPR